MQISQISATLDHKLAQLDQQLKKLEHERDQASGAMSSTTSSTRIDKDIQALQTIRAKLVKSKDIAWRAHQLQYANDEQNRARQRLIGLSLCTISVIGAGLLLMFVLNN